ncbi:MAG: amidotransferase [Bacteroidota bacterium]
MKVGLLLCDEVRPEFQPQFGKYPPMFERLFPDYEFVIYDVRKKEFPKEVADCDVYMATGSHHSVYEELDWIQATQAFIRKIQAANGYFIGFCFGHQLMAEALGGKVVKAVDKGWCVGVHQFEVYQTQKWMQPAKNPVHFLMMCQDQVVELPEDGVCLAGNERCPNAIVQVGERMMSVQAHPEFTKDYNRLLMETRGDRMGAETVRKGMASLELLINTAVFRDWVAAFLGG